VFKHLLVATDGSKISAKAVTHAFGLARALGAKLTAFYASPDYPSPMYSEASIYIPMKRKEYAAACNKEADFILNPIAAKAEAAGIQFNAVHSIAAVPWEAILAAAKKNKCDGIVMASHGRRGVSALLLGSETQKVLTHTKLPVIVVR
jgi:nucleotide-binding universal stress UspA family protein